MSRAIWSLILGLAIYGIGAEVKAQATDVDCSGCVNTSDIAAGAVSTIKIKRYSIKNSKIGSRAITTRTIKDGAINARTLQNGAVTAEKLSSEVSDAIDGSLGGVLLEQWVLSDGSGVASALCPSNRIVASANCHCEGDGETRNFGLLFACDVAGNGGVAGCSADSAFYNPNIPWPIASITLVCGGAIQNDGTEIQPVFSKAGSTDASKLNNSGIEFEDAVNKARSHVTSYMNRLQNR